MLVFFGAAPAGACRDPGVHDECGTTDHLVLLALLIALVSLIVLIAVALVRFIRRT